MSEFGYCKCGCGQKTRLAPRNEKRGGWIKGQPQPYIHGHSVKNRILGTRQQNRYEIRGDHAVLFIETRAKGTFECLVDIDDLPHVLPLRWLLTSHRPNSTPYVVHQTNRQGKKQILSMHHWLMGSEFGQQIDHVNRNGLDNRRSNLRTVSRSLNAYNSFRFSATGLRGSVLDKDARRRKPFKAQCSHHGKKLNLGRYATAQEAHAVVMRYLRDNKLIPT